MTEFLVPQLTEERNSSVVKVDPRRRSLSATIGSPPNVPGENSSSVTRNTASRPSAISSILENTPKLNLESPNPRSPSRRRPNPDSQCVLRTTTIHPHLPNAL